MRRGHTTDCELARKHFQEDRAVLEQFKLGGNISAFECIRRAPPTDTYHWRCANPLSESRIKRITRMTQIKNRFTAQIKESVKSGNPIKKAKAMEFP